MRGDFIKIERNNKYMVNLIEYEVYGRITELYFYGNASLESNIDMQEPLRKLYYLERNYLAGELEK